MVLKLHSRECVLSLCRPNDKRIENEYSTKIVQTIFGLNYKAMTKYSRSSEKLVQRCTQIRLEKKSESKKKSQRDWRLEVKLLSTSIKIKSKRLKTFFSYRLIGIFQEIVDKIHSYSTRRKKSNETIILFGSNKRRKKNVTVQVFLLTLLCLMIY